MHKYFVYSEPDYPLCPLYHGRGPPPPGPPSIKLPHFYRAVWTSFSVCRLKRNDND